MFPDPITPRAFPDLLQRADYDPFAIMPSAAAAHPRVFTTAAQLARARARIAAGEATDVACLATLRQKCQLEAPLPAAPANPDTDNRRGQAQASALRHALLCQLTGDARYHERATALLRLAAVGWQQALPKCGGYEGGDMAGFAEVYDLLAAGGLAAADDNLFRDVLFAFPGALDRVEHRTCNNHNSFDIMGRLAIGLALGHRQTLHDALYGCQRQGRWRYGLAHLLRHDFLADGMEWEGSLSYHMVVAVAVCPALTMLENAGVDLWHRPLPAQLNNDGFDEHRGYGPKGPKSVRAIFDIFLYQAFPNGDYSNVHDQILGNLRGVGAFGSIFPKAWEVYHDERYAWVLQRIVREYPAPDGSPLPPWLRANDTEFIRLEERQLPPGRFSFAADATIGQAGRHVNGCSLFPVHGSAMLRAVPEREDSPAVYLYYGPHWAGHRSPAALHVDVHAGGRRLTHAPHLFDAGYGDPKHLTWVRTTIAHNTVCIDEAPMFPFDFPTDSLWECDLWRDTLSDGRLVAFVPDPQCQSVRVVNDNVYPGVTLDRTLALTTKVLVDVYRVVADRPHTIDWAMHCHGTTARPPEAQAVTLGTHRGYCHFTDAWQHPQAGGWVGLPLGIGGCTAELQVLLASGSTLMVANDPPPDARTPIGDYQQPQPRRTFIVRARGSSALVVAVWSFGRPVVAELERGDAASDVSLSIQDGADRTRWLFPRDEAGGSCRPA